MELDHPLRRYRKNLGLSLETLADVAGVDKATISRIENGKQEPSLGLIRRLTAATAGRVTANDFAAAPEPKQEGANA